MKKLISIVGATASGKTAYSIELAKKLNTEIISCDSRQFFKELQIGSAVPTQEEMQGIPHHFIGNKSIKEEYNVGDYEQETLVCIGNLFEKYDTLILVGGSGLYEKAVVEGLDDLPKIPAEVRSQINENYQQFGLEYLQNELKKCDSEYYNKIDTNNPHRIIRGLEIAIHTGKSILEFQKQNTKQRNFEVERIGLDMPREVLYERINLRVEKMMEQGLLQEVKDLYQYKSKNALNTVGYKELFNFLDGIYSLDFAIQEIQKNTRRYAKRQLTWFRKYDSICWKSV